MLLSLFSKNKDPLKDELKRLEAEQKKIQSELQALETPSPSPLDSEATETSPSPPSPRQNNTSASSTELSIHRKIARNRLIFLGSIIFILLIIIVSLIPS